MVATRRPLLRSIDDCSNVENHTACPQRFGAWAEWAGRAGKTHRQEQCPECRFWVIWVPKGG